MGWLGDAFGAAVDFASSAVSTVVDWVSGGSKDDDWRRDRGDRGGYGSGIGSSTLYEPDKVKVAEIESAAKLKLAGAENDRIVLWKETQMELAEFNAKMEAAIIETRVRGFFAMQQALMGMLKEVNVVAEERLVLIEHANTAQIRKVEHLYSELEQDIKNDNFMTEKLPSLFRLLGEFPEGSDMRGAYLKGIELEMAAQIQFKTQQMQQLESRRRAVVDSVIASKQLIHQHINEVVSLRVQQMEQVMLAYKPQAMPGLQNAGGPRIESGSPHQPRVDGE